ncbi:MAG: acyl carrier protein [Bacteroidota bacterium]
MIATIELSLVDLLRTQLMQGSGREIPLDAPLSGLGLDSLALLNFLTAVEKRFGVELPDSIWAQKDDLTIRKFADLVRVGGGTLAVAPASPAVQDVGDTGYDGGAVSVSPFWHALARIMRMETFYLLARDLRAGSIPQPHPAIPLTLREGTLDDLPALRGFWPADKQERKEQRFRERLAKGFTPLTAWRDSEILGIDWISATGDFEPNTGLNIVTSSGTAYGFDLYEKHQGLGAGFALLCRSLHECVTRGFSRQVTLVSGNNVRMLNVATRLAGYEHAGSVRTWKLGKRRISLWRSRGTQGIGGTMIV